MPYEVDFAGFVSNTVAATWLERLRLQLMAEQFADVDLCAPQNLSVIARTTVEYVKPVRFTDRLEGQARVARFMNTSWTIEFSFLHAATGNEHLRAEQLGVFLDPVSLAPTRMPPQIRRRLAAMQDTRSPTERSIP